MNKFINFSYLRWTCHHLHIDKSNTINPYLLDESVKHMTNKWFYMRNIKKIY